MLRNESGQNGNKDNYDASDGRQLQSAIDAAHRRDLSLPTPRLTFFADVSFLNASVTPIHIVNQLPGSRSDMDRYGRT